MNQSACPTCLQACFLLLPSHSHLPAKRESSLALLCKEPHTYKIKPFSRKAATAQSCDPTPGTTLCVAQHCCVLHSVVCTLVWGSSLARSQELLVPTQPPHPRRYPSHQFLSIFWTAKVIATVHAPPSSQLSPGPVHHAASKLRLFR